MRITGGQYGGRIIVAPRSTATRPMTDKVREAIFNALGPLDGLGVLDAYAGSGALGLEAASWGAAPVVAVEVNRIAQKAITQNASALGIGEGYDLQPVTVEAYLDRNAGMRFNVIFADPPYAELKPVSLEKLGGLLARDGLLVVSHSARHQLPELSGLELAKKKVYGDTGISMYRPTEA